MSAATHTPSEINSTSAISQAVVLGVSLCAECPHVDAYWLRHERSPSQLELLGQSPIRRVAAGIPLC